MIWKKMKEESKQKGQLHFHYTREERLAMAPHLQNCQKSFFNRNKPQLMTFLDIVLILILVFILVPFLRSVNPVDNGLRHTLQAFYYDEQILYALEIENVRSELAETELRVEMIFGDEVQVFFYEVPGKGEKFFIHGQFLSQKAETELQYSLYWKDFTVHRKKKIN